MTESRKDAAQTVLHAVQAVALVVGGCWVAYQYFAHERTSQQLARAQQLLTTEQMLKLAATQRASEEAKLKQLQLANGQAALAATVQHEQQNLALQLQKLSVAQVALDLRVAQSHERLRSKELDLSVRLQELEGQKREKDLAFSDEYRFEPAHTLKCRKRRDLGGDLAEYELTYVFKLTNRSTTPFDISFYVVDLYVGEPTLDTQKQSIRRLNIPNLRNFTMGPATDDAFKWQHVNAIGGILQTESSHYGEVYRPPWLNWPLVDLKLNALGLGQIKNGESKARSETYFITARPSSYITAFVAYCFNSCRRMEDGFTGSNVVALADADAPISEKESPRIAEIR